MRRLAGLLGDVALAASTAVAVPASAAIVTVTFARALNPSFDTRGGPFGGSVTGGFALAVTTSSGFDVLGATLRLRPILSLTAE